MTRDCGWSRELWEGPGPMFEPLNCGREGHGLGEVTGTCACALAGIIKLTPGVTGGDRPNAMRGCSINGPTVLSGKMLE